MNHAQNKIVHALLTSTGLMPQKENIISGISNGRTASCRQLSHDEALALIAWLRQQQGKSAQRHFAAANNMRRKIIAMCHKLKWYKDGKINMDALNKWCIEHSYLKKPLNHYTYYELPKLVSQFQNVYASYLKTLK